MKIKISRWSNASGTWIKFEELEVKEVQETEHFYYVIMDNGQELEYAKDSVSEGSYRVEEV